MAQVGGVVCGGQALRVRWGAAQGVLLSLMLRPLGGVDHVDVSGHGCCLALLLGACWSGQCGADARPAPGTGHKRDAVGTRGTVATLKCVGE